MRLLSTLSIFGLGIVATLAACGSDRSSRSGFVESEEPSPPTGSLPSGSPPCEGPRCQVPSCPPGSPTVIEGHVYDPAGKTRLYNALVYVPDGELAPLPKGASCDQCGKLAGKAVTTALSDARGKFRLEDTPAGEDVPVVVQVGKFRRRIVVPRVEPCTTNTIPDGEARLPRNQAEGDLPRVAAVTGAFDELYCLLLRVGVEAIEHTTPDKPGAVHVYRGQGGPDHLAGGAPPATTLWDDVEKLSQYDVVLLGCEGNDYDGPSGNKSDAAKQAMREFTARGGRVFASHYQSAWFRKSASEDLRSVARFRADNGAMAAYGKSIPLSIDDTFPKGVALAEWLEAAGGSADAGSHALLADNVSAGIEAVTPNVATRWLYRADDRPAVTYLSFNTPVGAPPEAQCGRVVISDLHFGDELSTAKPPQCGGPITPAGLALEFLLFDLSACVMPDDETPRAPK